jgi:FkbM family methyltransferase
MRVFPGARYFLADPLLEHRSPLAVLSAQDERVSVWHGALGDREGTLLLHVRGHQSSFYSSPDGGGELLSVPVRTLDSFIESHQLEGPMLLKADVQGFELEVLGGARRCLDLTELLLLEVSFQPIYQGAPLADEVIVFLSKHGFRIYDICSYVQRPKDNELAQADLVFARKDSRLFSRIGWA